MNSEIGSLSVFTMDRVLNIICARFPFFRSAFEGHMLEVVGGAAISFLWRVVGAVGQFASVVIIARHFGTNGLGVYTIALTVCAIASTIGRIGLDQTLLRIIAVHADRAELDLLRDIYRKGFAVAALASLVVSVALLAVSSWLADAVFRQQGLVVPMRLMILSIVPFSLLNIVAAALQAVKRIQYASFVQVGIIPFINCALLLLVVSSGLDLYGAVLAYVISTIIVLYVGMRLLNRVVAGLGSVKLQGVMRSGELISVSMPAAWTSIMIIILTQVDILILGMFRPAEDVGNYHAAVKIVNLASFVLVAVVTSVMPKFAVMYESGDFASIGRVAKHSIRLMLVFTTPPLLVCILAPGFVLGIFGGRFGGAAESLIILAAGQLVFTAIGMAGQLLIMTRKEKALRNIMFASVGTNVVLGLALAPAFGANGVALAHVVAYILTAAASVYVAYRHMGIMMHPL